MNRSRLRLLKPHTHAGAQLPAGEVIDTANAAEAAWLVRHQVAEAITRPARTSRPATDTAETAPADDAAPVPSTDPEPMNPGDDHE